MPFEQGPHIQVAAFCESVLEDKTDVLSLIRVIDGLTHTRAEITPPTEMPEVTYEMNLVLMFKSGKALGRHELQIIPELPSGETKQPLIASVHFEGEERGQNIILHVRFTFTMEGLYWFNVYLDGNLFTKIPFRVKYQRIVTGPKIPV